MDRDYVVGLGIGIVPILRHRRVVGRPVTLTDAHEEWGLIGKW